MPAMNEEIRNYMRSIGAKGGAKTAARPDLSEIRRRGALLRWARQRKYKAAVDKKDK